MQENTSIMLEPDTTVSQAGSNDDVTERIARRVSELRAAQGHTLETLAARCGVSRSMISMIERAAANPTAVVLEKLAAGLGVTLASLFASGREGAIAQPIARRTEQAAWRDPGSGYVRRNLSPPGWPCATQLVEVQFPPGARVAYEPGGRAKAVQLQIWVLQGRIEVMHGGQNYALHCGDCLAIQHEQLLIYSNPTARAARYLVAVGDAAVSSTTP